MLHFKSMAFKIFKREDGEGVAILEMRDPIVKVDGALDYVSFYFTHKELVSLFNRDRDIVTDLAHTCRSYGEILTFYDMPLEASPNGHCNVPYVNVAIPRYVQRVLLRAISRVLARCVPGGERFLFDIPLARRESWAKAYGQATGFVSVVMDDVTAKEYDTSVLRDLCAQRDGRFSERIEHLRTIARNSTYSNRETAKIRLSRDGDGFFFQIVTPKGLTTLNGGVINHGTNASPDWSIHT